MDTASRAAAASVDVRSALLPPAEAVVVGNIPDASLRWLADLQVDTPAVPAVAQTPTMRRLPPYTSEWVSRCYCLCSALQLSTAPGHSLLGRKLHMLLPRMLFCPMGGLVFKPAAALMRQRCRQFVAGDWQELIDAAPPPLSEAAKKAMREESEDRRGYPLIEVFEQALYKMVCARPSAAVNHLLSSGVADPNSEHTWTGLVNLHFAPGVENHPLTDAEQSRYETLCGEVLPPVFTASVRHVLANTLLKLPKGVGAGPSGERYEHLRAVADTVCGMQSLVDMGMELVMGRFGPGMRASRLTALLKPDDSIRPVTTPQALRRAAGKAVLEVVQPRIEAALLPVHQLAFSSDGCQNVYGMVRHLLADNPSWVCAEGDESAAFQRASRPEMRRQLMEHLPELVPYFAGIYDSPSGIHWMDHQIPVELAQHGCQQGCTWGTLLFCLARRRMLEGLINDHPDVHTYSIADDIFFVGPPALVAAAFDDWKHRVAHAGGVVNVSKCAFWGPTAESTSHPLIEMLAAPTADGDVITNGVDVRPFDGPDGGMRVVGHPLGCDEFCRAFYDAKAAKTECLVDKIKEMCDYGNAVSVQSAYLALRFCAEPRIAHLLRVAPPALIRDAAARHDQAIQGGLNALLGQASDLLMLRERTPAWDAQFNAFGHVSPTDAELQELTRLAKAQAALPLRRGGFGLVRAVDVSSAAYLGGLSRLARFLAQERVATADEDGVHYGFPFSGQVFTRALLESDQPHCVAARTAWSRCSVGIARSSTVGTRIEDLVRCTGVDELHSADIRLQTLLSRELAEGRARTLRASCISVVGIDARQERARLLSTTGRGATAWLRAFPTGKHTRMASVEMRVSMQLWLGTILPTLAHAPARCHCWRHGANGQPAIADLRGHHDTVCRSNAFIYRHNAPLRAVQAALRVIGVASSTTSVLMNARATLADGTPDPNDVSKKQPDLVVHDPHNGGAQATLIDFVMTNPVATSNLNNSGRIGHAANSKETRKRSKYSQQAERNHFRFKAFGLETFGAWGAEATSCLAEWSAYATEAGRVDTRVSQGWSAAHWQDMTRQWVSVALQRENARLILNAAARRRQPVLSTFIRDAAMNGDGIEDDGDIAQIPVVAPRNGGGRLRHAAVAAAGALVSSSAASQRLASAAEIEAEIDALSNAAETAAVERRREAARRPAYDLAQSVRDLAQDTDDSFDAPSNAPGGMQQSQHDYEDLMAAALITLRAMYAADNTSSSVVAFAQREGTAAEAITTTIERLNANFDSDEELLEIMAGQLIQDVVDDEHLTAASSDARGSIMASAPVQPTDLTETCGICLHPLIDDVDEDGGVLGPSLQWPGCPGSAVHLFHRECIGEHLLTRARCPLCRHGVERGASVGALSGNFVNSTNTGAIEVAPLPADAAAAITTMASRLRRWLARDSTILYGGPPADCEACTTPNVQCNDHNVGASTMYVPLVHYGLRRAGYDLPGRIQTAPTQGGLLVDNAWRQVFQSLGRIDEWQHTLDAAAASVALCDHQTVNDTLHDMGNSGYLGWRGQQRLLSHGVNDGPVAGNLDAPGQQEDVFLGGAAGSGIMLAQSARHELRRDASWRDASARHDLRRDASRRDASNLPDTVAAENPDRLAVQNAAGREMASDSGVEVHIDPTLARDDSNADVNESSAIVVEPTPAVEVEVPTAEEPDSFRAARDEQDAEYAEALAADTAAETTAEANRVAAAAAAEATATLAGPVDEVAVRATRLRRFGVEAPAVETLDAVEEEVSAEEVPAAVVPAVEAEAAAEAVVAEMTTAAEAAAAAEATAGGGAAETPA